MATHPAADLLRHALDDAFVAMEQGAHTSASSPHNARRPPTPAQAAAGNYALGTVQWQGLTLRIENPRGTTRSGTDPDGKAWSNTMAAHYGYIAGTRGADGDAVDVFVGPVPEATGVWVINQANADGSFDEHKVLVGFLDEQQALTAYRNSYDRGWNRIRSAVRLTPDQLRWWLKFADTGRDLTLNLVPPASGTENPLMDSAIAPKPLSRVYWTSEAEPRFLTLDMVLYTVRGHDAAEGLLLDAVTMADITEGATVAVMDALVVEAGRLQPKLEALMRVMQQAAGEVQPLALQLSDPIKRFGGVHVAALFELSDGQTITIWFHNPDLTPAKFSPADSLVSWKWMLNKKDVTVVVAPESGADLNTRVVAQRLMKLAEKNSAAFQRANTNRAARMQEVEGLKEQLSAAQGRLASLHDQIAAAKIANEEREAKAAADRAAADRAQGIVASVVAELGGSLSAWRPAGAGTAGLWEYATVTLNGQDVEVGASGGGVISVAGDSHSPAGTLITTADTFRAALWAVAAPKRQPRAAEAVYEFKTVTEEALKLLTIGAQNPAPRSTYKAAVAVERQAEDLGLSVAWFAQESLPVLDAVGDGLFPDIGADGYIGGTISRGTFELATVHLRDDGMVLFKPNMAEEAIAEAMTYTAATTPGDLANEVMNQWLDEPGQALQWLADASEHMGKADPEHAAFMAEQERKRAEQEAQETAARDAALKAAQEFGAGKPGFCGAVLNTSNGQSIKDALARKPVGSFVLVVDRDWNNKDAATFGVVMFTRQKLGKKGGLDPAGSKTGNLQATGMLPTAAEAYAKGIENIQRAAGVVLEQSAQPVEPEPQPQPAPEPAPPADRPEVAFLREVLAGGHDALALGDLLDKLETNVRALNDAGALEGDVDALAGEAITHWAQLEEKAAV